MTARTHSLLDRAVILTMGAFAYGLCAAQEPEATLLSEAFHEELRTQVPVSGSPIVGATIGALPDGAFQSLAVLTSSELLKATDICVTGVTQDGRYRSQNSYRLPVLDEAQPIRLPFPTRHVELLQNARFTVLARIGSCSSNEIILPVFLNAQRLDDRSISVAVNGGGNAISIATSRERSRSRRCIRADTERPIAFDSLCKIDVNHDGSPHLSVWIEERRGAEIISVTPIVLATGL